MSAYRPAAGVYPGMPPCEACGANFHLHRPPSGGGLPARISGARLRELHDLGTPLWCPRRDPERTDRLEVAQAELEAAEASGDPARVFVARGNLQRLQRR